MELINKYRPQTFDEVVGHDRQVAALEHALEKGAARTFLFTGPSGVGKTTLARIAAAALGDHELVEVDAATNTGIDDMRALAEACSYQPLAGSKRAVIIDEFHALSKAAVQSWLKRLEEPSPWSYWFLCTTEPNRVLATVLTRCFRVDLRPVRVRDLTELLGWVAKQEKVKLPPDVIALCAEEANGSPRQALSNLAMCLTARTEDEAAQALHSAVSSAEAVDLARALVRGEGWRDVLKLVHKLQETNPESVRRVVLRYVEKVVLGAKEARTAQRGMEILEAFGQPYYHLDGASPLLIACRKVIF